MTERMGKLTTLIKDNADLIKDFGSALGEVVLTVENIADKGVSGLVSLAGAVRDVYKYREDSLVEKYKDKSDVQSAEALSKSGVRPLALAMGI